MERRFCSMLKERTGIEKLTEEQIEEIRGLVNRSHEWEAKKIRECGGLVEMSTEEYDMLWDVNSYTLTDAEKEKLKGLDQKTIFNNMLWLFHNTHKIDQTIKRPLGMHVWVIDHWIKTVGSATVRKFLRDNEYGGDFVYFLYKYFNL
ncbi:hypothetical protein OCOL_001767 [Ordospora colligata]|uniref:Uncharacterized protein n=1 Tax=Ordospora colligata OC4 TaxID=1354746 RepID=A0A0B2UJJ7_9MICR|nr:uncharacterized protein M896_091450 [Ordospora colligata OC4]KHN69217.1 hypothetical protein M896_091450 [Ordospora colligata OC4]TBU14495.1 hypothetical protein CWI40_091410 [Ordospora colligata]TBU14672.1 hypothetical protein CWI41_091440 [Ordospora colligata]